MGGLNWNKAREAHVWFEQIIRRETGCASYLVGSTESRECIVYDPLWDPYPYLACAKRYGSRIRYVIDSHSHADHVSGARRVAAEAGAELVLGELAEIEYEATRVKGGDRLRLGELEIEMLHTPGHRPEQLCLVITDHSRGPEPWCMLSADFLMVGDVARPDLAGDGTEGAKIIYDEALTAIEKLPDFVEVYPGHVSGST